MREKYILFLIALIGFTSSAETISSCSCEVSDINCTCKGEESHRFKRQDAETTDTTTCSEVNLNDIIPSHLMVANKSEDFPAEVGTKIRLRCGNGKVVHTTYDGYFDIECADTGFDSNTEWPTPDVCVFDGRKCNTADAPVHEYYLERTDTHSGKIDSGTKLTYDCSQAGKVLVSDTNCTEDCVTGYDIECFNGEFIHSEFPPVEQCIDGAQCDVELFTERRSYMEAINNLTGLINHGGNIQFTCKDNRILTPTVYTNNKFAVNCYNGDMVREGAWPEDENCHTFCTQITVLETLNFTDPGNSINVMSGNYLQLDCKNTDHVVNDTWKNNYINIKCLHSGEFEKFNPWPACYEKKPCGPSPEWPVNSALRPIYNDSRDILVADSAIYTCKNASLVTDLGPQVEIPCIFKPGDSEPSFDYPIEWGGKGTKCREPVICKPPFDAPLETGLSLVQQQDPYLEFQTAKFRCNDTSLKLWKDQELMNSQVFEVTCGLGGTFLPPEIHPEKIKRNYLNGWPLCDRATPAKCSNYQPANAEQLQIVELIKKEDQLPGGKIFYKCKEEGYKPNLGDQVEFECRKYVDGSGTKYQTPNGWNNLKCRSEKYPNFKADECICPGDEDVTTDQHLEILKLCYEYETQYQSNSYNVPMKKRCGVGDLANITKDAICYCTERSTDATDYAIWSRVEIPNFDYHANFTEPTTTEFIQLKKLIEKEFDKKLVGHSKFSEWRYVRTKVVAFAPSNPKQCSLDELPEPPDGYGLRVKSKKSIDFGKFAEYECEMMAIIKECETCPEIRREQFVIDSGYTFKLKCLPNGKFQSPSWQKCRQPMPCELTPPYPPSSSGLVPYNPYEYRSNYTMMIREFSDVRYECKDEKKIVKGTIDGAFRVGCKKRGKWPQAKGKYGIEWPVCEGKPEERCEPVLKAPHQYMDDFERLLYVEKGDTISFKCVQDRYLAGDAAKLEYKCQKKSQNSGGDAGAGGGETIPDSGNSTATGSNVTDTTLAPPTTTAASLTDYELVAMGHDGNNVPACRAPAICYSLDLKNPPEESGLTKPLQASDLYELEYIDYSCINKGKTWSLLGEYQPVEDYIFNSNVAIIDGNLRINCVTNGVLGQVTKWPVCRNSEVKGCDVSDTNPVLPADDLAITPTNTFLEFGQTVSVHCKENGNKITDGFVKLELKCQHDGLISAIPENINLTSCRDKLECSADSPVPPANLNTSLELTGLDPEKEHDVQKYQCENGYTLAGITHELINSDGQVELPCILYTPTASGNDSSNGTIDPKFLEPKDWPVCQPIVSECSELPTNLHATKALTDLPVSVGQKVTMACARKDPDEVTYLGTEFEITCTESGAFAIPDPKPYCRAPIKCLDPPEPANTTLLERSNNDVVREWTNVPFKCQEGSKIPDDFTENVENGEFMVPCGSKGTYPESVTWPECEITHCMEIPEKEKFKTDKEVYSVNENGAKSPAIEVSDIITYSCSVPGEVPDDATKVLESTCLEDGTFSEIQDWSECRAAMDCEDPKIPLEGTFLLPTETEGVKEFEYAFYSCQDGAKLPDTDNDDFVDGQFRVQCGQNGKYLVPIEWPTCIVENCTSLLTQEGYYSETVVPVAVDDVAIYKCDGYPDKVFDDSAELPIKCGPDGQFITPSWPACRPAGVCTNIQEPTSESFLEKISITSVKEFQYATYPCKADGKFGNDEKTSFDLQCPKGIDGHSPDFLKTADVSWPKCVISKCLVLPSPAGFTKAANGPVDVGKDAKYECISSGQVTDDGRYQYLTCLEDGSFGTNPGDSWKSCRPPTDCETDLPIPEGSSKLENSASTNVKEFDFAIYTCEETFTLEGVQGENVENNQFKVQCGLNGEYPVNITWPTCKPTVCPADAIPNPTGLTTAVTGNTPIGNSIDFTCATSGEIMDSLSFAGKTFSVKCQENGNFEEQQYQWPTCRPSQPCLDPIPTPPNNSNLKASTSTVANEFDEATYECESGLSYFEDGTKTTFSLTCGVGGSFPWEITWPKCTTSECDTLPTDENFKTSAQPPILVGNKINFECSTANHVHDTGKYVIATCQDDGTFKLSTDDAWPTCRPAIECSDTPPTPPDSSNLQSASNTPQLEFDEAIYPCQSGHAIAVSGDTKFKLACSGINGTYPTMSDSDWGICLPKCTDPIAPSTPAPNGKNMEAKDNPLSVVAGQTTIYQCETQGYVTDIGDVLEVTCGTDGNFIEPEWPDCRPAVSCETPPIPPSSTNLQPTSSTGLKEYQSAKYSCKNQYNLEGVSQPSKGKIMENGASYNLQCNKGGVFAAMAESDWPKCIPESSKKRKKRFIVYPGLRADISYTINVYFETQWMYAGTVEDDILEIKNYSLSNPNFPRAIVDVFHEKIEKVLGNPDSSTKILDMGALKLKYPIHPTCEQPMLDEFICPEGGCTKGCVPSDITPTCPNDLVESPWLKALGFTYMKQEPNWMTDGQIIDGKTIRHKIPVGGAVEFYCNDTVKRPKKDVWDDDDEDGIIRATCYYGETLSMTMNPADWDRCRRLCPIKKPEPPTAPGAQLVPYPINDNNFDQELWEDETIDYGCENGSLVLNRKKGVQYATYKCQDDGTYATPKGKEEGDPWPECTLRPVDPFIVEAVVLLTGKMDRNLVYREALKNTTGDDVISTDTIVAIISITVPVVVAIVVFVFFCMCATRADSPVCRLFEPQA